MGVGRTARGSGAERRARKRAGGAASGPPVSPLRLVLYSLLTVALLFALLEGVLWLAGTRTLAEERDPSLGFSGLRLFERDRARGVYATSARAVRHSVNYQEFALDKPENGLRVFTIGGSSAYGFPWGAKVAFPSLLGKALAQSLPGRAVESVNAAAMSYGSTRLRAVAGEIEDYAPDILVIFEGHNEFVEASLQRRLQEVPAAPARGVLDHWRLYAAMTRLWERTRPKPQASAQTPETGKSLGELLGIDVVRQTARYVGEQAKSEAAARLRGNYAAILEDARRRGTAVLLCTVPWNESGWAPNQSVFAESTPLPARRLTEEAIAGARERLDRGDAEGALALLEPARRAAPGYAETAFRLGQAYEALGRWEEARAAYREARDGDAMPTRVTSAINDAIRSLGSEPGVTLVDVERLFEQEAPHGLVGFDLVEDYVHPNPRGHRLIARALWEAILSRGIAGARAPADAAVFEAAVGPPEDGAAGAEGSPQLLYNLGIVLERQGRIEDAIRQFRACLERDPRYVAAAYNLGRLLHKTGRFAEAAAAHRQALAADPRHVLSLVGLGEALRALGRLEEARRAYVSATEVDAGNAYAWNGLGATLAQGGRPAEAEAAFRRALALEPQRPDIRTNLAFALLDQGKAREAEPFFREAMRARPDHLGTRDGLARALAEMGRVAEARALFEETLRLAPDDRDAAEGLARLRGR
ncbi:MAG TPA: tetratricopeptide repeat protein [Candidatus Polarisedimenticolaceae bacterium]|nr:tetratricopeptide repeat protein [Candidatus Polarisedimenticolaceae bacterium]